MKASKNPRDVATSNHIPKVSICTGESPCTRGPLWLGAKFLRDRVVLLFFPAHVQNDMRWFWAVFAHRLTCSCFWMTARCSHVWCQPAFRLRRGIVNQTSIASDMFCSPKFLESHTQKHAICAKWVIWSPYWRVGSDEGFRGGRDTSYVWRDQTWLLCTYEMCGFYVIFCKEKRAYNPAVVS